MNPHHHKQGSNAASFAVIPAKAGTPGKQGPHARKQPRCLSRAVTTTLTILFLVSCNLSLAAPAAADEWADIVTVSSTQGLNANHLCTAAPGHPTDIGCPTTAPYLDPTTGNIGIGTVTPTNLLTISANSNPLPATTVGMGGTLLRVAAQDAQPARIVLETHANSSNFSFLNSGGTAAVPTATQDGDDLGQVSWFGYGQTAYAPLAAAAIRATAVGNWSDTNQGTMLNFYTTPSNTTSSHAVASMRIADNGNVGIGTANPTATLEVNGYVSASFVHINGDGGLELQSNNDDGAYIDFKGNQNSNSDYVSRIASYDPIGLQFFTASGTVPNVYMSTNFNTYVYGSFVVSGTAYKPGGGSWADSSDRRLKTNIQPIHDALAKLEQLQGVTFNWKDPRFHTGNPAPGGFVAQNVRKVFPEFVSQSDCTGAECKLVDNGKVYKLNLPFKFDAYLVEAIKEQQVMLEKQQAALDRLEAEDNNLRSRLSQLESGGR